MEDWQRNLVAYGTHLLASQLGQAWPSSSEIPKSGSLVEGILRQVDLYDQDERLGLARKIIHDSSLSPGLSPLPQVQSVAPIFTLLSLPPGVAPRDWVPFSLTALNIPASTKEKRDSQSGQETQSSSFDLWCKFWEALKRLSAQGEFDTFFHLIARYGWYVPGTIAHSLLPGFEHGLSVFEQFKAIAALSHCLDPTLGDEQPIGLVAGDLPGIQRVLYTITAKGATKTLRGHSAYLQLLSDALVRLLLQHLKLSWANVVFNAGGNFLIVTPKDALGKVSDWRDTINDKLLTLHRGELYLALAEVTLPARLYAGSSTETEPGGLAEKRTELQRRLEASKHAAFAELAQTRYSTLFEPIGQGGGAITGQEDGNLCQVCHVEVREETREFERDPKDPTGGGTLFCEQCHSFVFRSPDDADFKYNSLAWNVANANRVFISAFNRPLSLHKYRHGKGNPPWNVALRALGLDYQFLESEKGIPSRPGALLAFDPDQSLPKVLETDKSYGFHFLSRLTPREAPPQKEIRDFHSMAREDAVGIPRYGVLRMDVDSLGQMMSGKGLKYPDLLHLSALSNALDFFFGGMLDQIGRECANEWQKHTKAWTQKTTRTDQKWPYIIYAGGDDLFIVAAWDLLPPLAQAIQEQFSEFCSDRLTMSGGIAIAREKYPLYRAAEQAGLALDQSKDRVVKSKGMLVKARKNALTFLGVTLSWKDIAAARALAEKLVKLLNGYPDGDKAPRALLQLLHYVAWLYQHEAAPTETDSVALGQWLPALHYGLRRMQRRVPETLREELASIPNRILDLDSVWGASSEPELREAIRNQMDDARYNWPAIRYLGLPVRWAEFLTRKEE